MGLCVIEPWHMKIFKNQMGKMNMKNISRRKVIKSAAIGAGATLISAPAIATNIIKWKIRLNKIVKILQKNLITILSKDFNVNKLL